MTVKRYTHGTTGMLLREDGEWCRYDALAAELAAKDERLAEAEGALRLALEYWAHRQQRYKNRHPVWVDAANAALADSADECLGCSSPTSCAKNGCAIKRQRAADSASAVQPERCCLDYPRCDCNSPPEPDDDWLCFQRPAQPKVTP